MITVVYAFVLVVLMIAPVVVLAYFDRRHQQKTGKRLLEHFEQKGAAQSLQFSSQEVLPHLIMGLDGQQRRLLVAWKEDDSVFKSRLIDLDGVRHCAVLEDGHHVAAASFLASDDKPVIDRVVLQLEQETGPPAEIAFFDAAQQSRNTLHQMKQKAGKWKAIIAQLVTTKEPDGANLTDAELQSVTSRQGGV